jgi:hypothetical protein
MAIQKKAAAKIIFSVLIVLDCIAFFETVITFANTQGERYEIQY